MPLTKSKVLGQKGRPCSIYLTEDSEKLIKYIKDNYKHAFKIELNTSQIIKMALIEFSLKKLP